MNDNLKHDFDAKLAVSSIREELFNKGIVSLVKRLNEYITNRFGVSKINNL
jgi:hypothetical protein